MPSTRPTTSGWVLGVALCGCAPSSSGPVVGDGSGSGGESTRCFRSLEGDVEVDGAEDLEALDEVRRIGGELSIRGNVGTLEPLACLEEVGGRLRIENTDLEDLRGLEGLASAESLRLAYNGELVTTRGLGVESLYREPDELAGFNTSLSEVVGNHSLVELRFDALREMGTIGIGRCGPEQYRVGNDALRELGAEAFPVLASGGTLAVSAHSALTSLDSLVERLAEQASFRLVFVQENPRIDGPAFRAQWESAGLGGIPLTTCGNGGEEPCMCPVTE
ncbi:MAG: hypothetical protein AAGA54_07320 [Myxococcota bacterium]